MKRNQWKTNTRTDEYMYSNPTQSSAATTHSRHTQKTFVQFNSLNSYCVFAPISNVYYVYSEYNFNLFRVIYWAFEISLGRYINFDRKIDYVRRCHASTLHTQPNWRHVKAPCSIFVSMCTRRETEKEDEKKGKEAVSPEAPLYKWNKTNGISCNQETEKKQSHNISLTILVKRRTRGDGLCFFVVFYSLRLFVEECVFVCVCVCKRERESLCHPISNVHAAYFILCMSRIHSFCVYVVHFVIAMFPFIPSFFCVLFLFGCHSILGFNK